MSSVAVANESLIAKSLRFSKVLYFGSSIYRYLYCVFAASWVASYCVSIMAPPNATTFLLMVLPAILQSVLAMDVGIRASNLLQNPQLHLVGIRKELFVNLLVFCVLLSLPVYDPKSAQNLINAKLISFTLLSFGMLIMVWLYSFQILSIFMLSATALGAIFLVPVFNITLVLMAWSLLAWGYFAWWLAQNSLQRTFKFENFNSLFDYLIERLRLLKFRRILVSVYRKEHAILLGDGDGHISRLFFASAFSLIFTGIYVVAMQSLKELALWMILMHLSGSKARIILGQHSMRLWLLNDGDRLDQFRVTEALAFRLYGYTFLTALLILAIWIAINPGSTMHGIITLCVAQLFIIAADYYNGFITKIGSPSLLLVLLTKMTFMFAIAYSSLDFIGYAILAATITLLGVALRQRAKHSFLTANLTARAS